MKKKKHIKWETAICVVCLCSVVITAAVHKRNQIYHTVCNVPKGLNITLYEGAFSRGFSWWTEDRIGVAEETQLFLSERPFSSDDFDSATPNDGDIDQCAIEGIYLIEGKTQLMKDRSTIGRLLYVSYCNHKVFVDDLRAGQKYYYAVGDDDSFLFGEFETAADEETVIINFNDYQTNCGEKLYYGADTLSAARSSVSKPLDFFAFGGDFTSVFTRNDKQYNHYLGWIESREMLAPYIGHTPLVMAAGNHDAEDELFFGNNTVNFDGVTSNGGYYSFDYNNIHFVVLNTNAFEDTQRQWLRKDLDKAASDTNVDWRIIMLHKGPYTTGDHGFAMQGDDIEDIAKICSDYKVDLVLQAHDHTYSKTLPYKWGSDGFMLRNDNEVVNYEVKTISEKGITYDLNPNGTYYVSCGASGHRIGENVDYAKESGEKSYTKRAYKTAISTVAIQSEYFNVGESASADLNKTMFGTLWVKEKSLTYDFFVVNEGQAVHIDRLAIVKQ